MNEKTAKKSIGSYFTIKNRKYEVTKVDHFSGELHFGFMSADQDGRFICGWIPVAFVGQCEW